MVLGDALPWVLTGDTELLPAMFDFLGPLLGESASI